MRLLLGHLSCPSPQRLLERCGTPAPAKWLVRFWLPLNPGARFAVQQEKLCSVETDGYSQVLPVGVLPHLVADCHRRRVSLLTKHLVQLRYRPVFVGVTI